MTGNRGRSVPVLRRAIFGREGPGWVQTRCKDPARIIVVVEIGRVEMAAAFASKLRGGFITGADYQKVRARLEADTRERYHLIPVTSQRVDEANAGWGGTRPRKHPARGFDSRYCVRPNQFTAHASTPAQNSYIRV